MYKAVLIKAIVYTVSNALANMISYSPFVLSLYFKDEVYVFLVNELDQSFIFYRTYSVFYNLPAYGRYSEKDIDMASSSSAPFCCQRPHII